MRNVMAHGTALRRGADAAQARLIAIASVSTDLVTDVPYVRIQPGAKMMVSDVDLGRLGLVPIMRRVDHVIAAYATDGRFGELRRKIDQYQRRTAQHDMLSRIEILGPWTRADRSSPRIAALEIEKDRQYTVDVMFLPTADQPIAQGTRAAVARFVGQRGGRVLDEIRSTRFEAMRVRVGGQALDLLLEHRDDVALVDLPPRAQVAVPAVLSFAIDDLPEAAAPGDSAPAICVIDAGIIEGHPLLENTIVAERSITQSPALGSPIPAVGTAAAHHGTTVAGVAAYGDIARCVTAKRFEPAALVINARILDDHLELDPDRMPFVRKMVEQLAGTCRIFNLSFGLEACSSTLSSYATDLDALARERDAVFVVAAGNLPPTIKYPHPRELPAHPGYLLDDDRKVLQPAEALNALTVGSISTSSDPFPPGRLCRGAAGKRSPSPFTRCGALQHVVKPELVEEGGDLGIEPTCGWENNVGLRIPSTGPEFATGKLFTYTEGTSIAAPKIAHLAARLLGSMPDASANLVRALLVNSATYPEGVREYPHTQAMRLCGFGVPDVDRAQYCTDMRGTLYFAGEIEIDAVLIFEIPVPRELNEAKGRKRITLTVAYDPPVSALEQVRPAGINLTWKVAKSDVSDDVIMAALVAAAERELAAADGDDAHPVKTKKKVFEDGTLPRLIQKRGTVQKNVFEWTRRVPGDTWRLALTAKATRAAHAKELQRYAIAVTIEHTSNDVEVYQSIRARLPAGRVRVRVPAAR